MSLRKDGIGPEKKNLQLGNMRINESEKSLSELRKELRIKWYRCPIEAKELRELSKRSDAKGFQLTLGHLGIWLTTGTLTFLFANAGW